MTKSYKPPAALLAVIGALVLVVAVGSLGSAATLTSMADSGNVGFVLVRSYLPANGFNAVPLPTLTVIQSDGSETTLDDCPWRDRSKPPSFSAAEKRFKKGKEGLARTLRKIAKEAGVREEGVSPYCSWWFVLDNNSFNIAYPDSGARYWGTPFIADENTEIRIDGVFADQRYMSLIVYSGLNFFTYTAPDGTEFPSNLPDYLIEPNIAGQNPFQDDMGVINAPYTVTIKANPVAGDTNVLPAFPNPTAAPEADPNLLSDGVFPLPCNTQGSPYTCTPPALFSAPPSGAQAGFFGNPDNTYIPALVDLRVPRGDKQQQDRIYVIRGKIPTTPPGESPVQWTNPAFELRYWSICTGAYVRPYPTVEGDFACVADNAIVKTDADGQITPDGEYFTVVLSTERARPTILTGDPQKDGVNWLRGIDFARTIVLLRNMLANKDFAFAAQNVPTNGSWVSAVKTMKGYYPAITTQCTRDHFDQHGWGGCVAPAIMGTHPDFPDDMPPGPGVSGTPTNRQVP